MVWQNQAYLAQMGAFAAAALPELAAKLEFRSAKLERQLLVVPQQATPVAVAELQEATAVVEAGQQDWASLEAQELLRVAEAKQVRDLQKPAEAEPPQVKVALQA